MCTEVIRTIFNVKNVYARIKMWKINKNKDKEFGLKSFEGLRGFKFELRYEIAILILNLQKPMEINKSLQYEPS